MGGWIKLHRDIKDHWLWTDKPFSRGQAWIDLLMMVNHDTGTDCIKGRVVTIERGQRITSTVKLADRWKWGRKKVSTFLDRLEAEGMLEQKRTTEYTTITIVNYGVYQSKEQRVEQPRNSQGTAEEQPRNTNKNKKNNKNEKNNNIPAAEQLEKDFESIYEIYPKKVGRTKAFDNYKTWLTGKVVNGKRVKLTNQEMYIAVQSYVDQQKGTELKFYKNFDTLMGKQLLDYVGGEEIEQPEPDTGKDDDILEKYKKGKLGVEFNGWGDLC